MSHPITSSCFPPEQADREPHYRVVLYILDQKNGMKMKFIDRLDDIYETAEEAIKAAESWIKDLADSYAGGFYRVDIERGYYDPDDGFDYERIEESKQIEIIRRTIIC